MAELLSLPDGSTISNSMSPIYTGLSAPLALTATGLREIIRRAQPGRHSSCFWDSQGSAVLDEDEHEHTRGRFNSPAGMTKAVHPSAYLIPQSNIEPHRAIGAHLGVEPEGAGRHISAILGEANTVKYSSSSHVDAPIEVVSSYVTKGAFRFQKYQEPGEFRFPKTRSQQEPTWRPGDGFSDDEVKPGFIPLTTGKRKRKRSRSLSAFGQLSLETENATPDSSAGIASSQRRLRGRRAYRTEVTDPWPTRENFMEDSITNNAENAGAQSYGIVSSAPQFIPRCPPTSTLQTKQAMPRKRRGSDFENFGKHVRKSRSCHRRRPSSIFTTSPQGYDSEASDEGDGEERNGPYENVEDESGRQSVTDEELEDMSTIIVEDSDNGSVMLGEGNFDEDEVMQGTIQDSQPDEIPSGRFEVGEKFEAYLLSLARRLPSAAAEDAVPHARPD
ncbi:hypothetical protein EKO27_g6952 [Xylaria grammica]|uniref:Uncharacterized protein n=1 Tax=Xylaria grammica TaxID=363999 RepID=A0A439D114_9PEZI|nr:hypothetical protein EKO27_g6952 [Xylaria grammica]